MITWSKHWQWFCLIPWSNTYFPLVGQQGFLLRIVDQRIEKCILQNVCMTIQHSINMRKDVNSKARKYIKIKPDIPYDAVFFIYQTSPSTPQYITVMFINAKNIASVKPQQILITFNTVHSAVRGSDIPV